MIDRHHLRKVAYKLGKKSINKEKNDKEMLGAFILQFKQYFNR
jgi:hypothetical protein